MIGTTDIQPNEAVSADWAGRLVAGWCRHEANKLTPLIRRCHNAYREGPMVAEVAKYAEILERHRREWREAAAGWRAHSNAKSAG